MNFIYFVCIILVIILDYYIARKFSDIAEMKGHNGNSYFWWTFIFGFVGMLMVIALPNIRPVENNTKSNPSSPAEKWLKEKRAEPEQTSNTENVNKNNPPVNALIKDGEKVCPKCGQAQKADRKICWSCGQKFDN